MEHTLKQHDRDLDLLRRSLLEMGGLVEGQMRGAMTAFAGGSRAHMDQVAHNEQRVNRAEVDIADCCSQMIAKRQPAAADLRLVVRELVGYMMEDPRTIPIALDIAWIAKAVERIGDHAKNVAEHVMFIVRGIDVRHASQADAG